VRAVNTICRDIAERHVTARFRPDVVDRIARFARYLAYGRASVRLRPMRKRSSIDPTDPKAVARLLADVAAGHVSAAETIDGKNPAAVALGRKGGLKGGKARAESLSSIRRSEIALLAAKARWDKPR